MGNGKYVRQWLACSLAAVFFAVAAIACSPQSSQGPSDVQPTTESRPSAPLPPSLAEVEPVPNPTLPDWIDSIDPRGSVEPLSQIRIRFQNPLIPLERLDTPAQQELLDKFQIEPELPGTFRFLTPRMVGFQADRALPKSTRVRVTLNAGLEDLSGNALQEDLAWSFETEDISLNLPVYSESSPLQLDSTFSVGSNVELDIESLQDLLTLTSEAEEAIPVDITPAEQRTLFEEAARFDASQQRWQYTITPKTSLSVGMKYQIAVSPGLLPAYGNLPSLQSFEAVVTTFQPFRFQELKLQGRPSYGGAFGRFVNGSPRLDFNNRVDPESAIAHIHLSPAPVVDEDSSAQLISPSWNSVEINPWLLEPNTDYTIAIDAELTDIYGQALGESTSEVYSSEDIASGIWVAEGLNVFPAGQGVNLNIASVNLPEGAYRAQYRVVDPKDLAYTTDASWWSDRNNLLSEPESWPDVSLDTVPPNELVQTPVPIQDQLGGPTGMLAYGVGADALKFVDNQGQQQTWKPAYSGLVQLTNLGVFAQVFPESAVVRAHHLSDGSPAAVEIEVYEQQINKRPADRTPKSALTPCATGNADDNGIATLTAVDLSACMAGEDTFAQPPELLVVVREGDDWAFARLWQYSGAWGYGFWSGWEGGDPTSRGTVFSDRQLYQPGEEAEFTAVAYSLVKGELKREANTSFDVVLRSPDGEEDAMGSFTTNDYGTVSIPYTFDDKQPLGYYSIEASSDNATGEDGVTLFGEFRVAEFKPPNFKAELQLDTDIALPNDTVAASLQSNYLFGAPVDNGKVRYTVTRSREFFVPDGWEEFRFGRSWFWPEEVPTVSSEVLQVDEVLDESGSGTQAVTVGDDLPYPMTYRFEGAVSDASNLSVSGTQTFTALPSDRLIGLNSDFVAEAEQPFDVELIVTDPEGNALNSERVTVELQKIDYKTVTQSIEGSEVARNQAEYTTVDTVQVRSKQDVMTVQLTPPESGSYRIRANFPGASEETTATDLQIWVSGDEPVWWGDRGNRLEIRLDKDTYKVGDTATVLVESPYANAELSLAVIRHNTLFTTTEAVEGGAPQLQFQVTPDMLPNATVQVLLVRQGVPLSEVKPDSLDALSKVGFATFNADLGNKYLQVDVSPVNESVGPGDDQTVRLAVSDRDGRPTTAEVTVMVVNESILQLNGYRPPNLVDVVFADQPISTRFADNRPDIELEAPASSLSKGWGYGGGLSAGGEGTRVRTDFKPLAYYGTVETDEGGTAEVTFTLPDDLTTWRVMAVASAKNELQFGNGDATFIATQPLLANPILPQFARLGDRFDLGVSVTNTTGESGQLQVNSQLGLSDRTGSDSAGDEALPIRFAEGDGDTSIANLSDSIDAGTEAYRFRVNADRVGTASIQFDTQLNDFGDAFQVPLEVQNLPVTEQTVETGTTEDRVEIPLSVDDVVLPNTGGLELNLASSLLPPIVSAIPSAALGSDWIPCLEPAASRLEIAANIKRLQDQYGQQASDFDG
ncbi:MAG: Ig-like domain-containing protein, partial [Synechococcus sp.]